MASQDLPLETTTVGEPLPIEWSSEKSGVVTRRLGTAEVRRRLLHMIPGIIPVGLPLTPHSDVWEPLLFTAACLFACAGLLCAMIFRPYVLRHSEEDWTAAVVGYILPVFGAFLLFPGRSELALMGLQIVAFGDGSATLGGKLIGGVTLPWNPRKTLSGLVCFVVAGSLAATYSYWGEARPAVTVSTAFFICVATALCAGLAESLPVRGNDNFRVGMTAVIVGTAISFWAASPG